MKSWLFSVVLLLISVSGMQAQTSDSTLVQFSGMIVTEDYGQIIPVPYVNVIIEGTGRGTYSNLDGFFSIVARKGDVVLFSAMGFKPIEYAIPDSLTSDRYTIYQMMTTDDILLPETVVYPWPSREHFNLEFLAMDVNNKLQSRAEENLSDKTMDRMIEYLPSDGRENANVYLRQQANERVYDGQIQPQNIFNPLAWAKFVKAWKNGDFKNKDKKK